MTAHAIEVAGPRARQTSAAQRSSSVPWAVVGCFVVVTAAGLLAGPAGMVKLAYAPAALLVALYLRRADPGLYLGFTWWLAFLSPLARRLVDYRAGFDSTNPILIAPFVVAGLTLIDLARYSPKLLRREFAPFALLLLALAYGFFVGLARFGPIAPLYALLTWLVPVSFGFYNAVHWRRYPLNRQVTQRTFAVATVVLGIYGIWQFMAPPPWDVYWIVAGGQSQVLNPEPYHVRVFGTLTTFGIYALIMMTGTLIAIAGPLRRAVLVVPIGVLALLLSSVRTAWGALTIGLLLYLAYLPNRGRALLFLASAACIATLLIVGFGALPLGLSQPFRAVIEPRFGTLTQLNTDGSYLARRELYQMYAKLVSENPIGAGLGGSGRAATLSESNVLPGVEHGLQDVVFSLGWFGGAVYFAGGFLLLLQAFRARDDPRDRFPTIARAISAGVVAMLLFGNVFISLGGFVLWGFLGSQTAARRHAMSGPEAS